MMLVYGENLINNSFFCYSSVILYKSFQTIQWFVKFFFCHLIWYFPVLSITKKNIILRT